MIIATPADRRIGHPVVRTLLVLGCAVVVALAACSGYSPEPTQPPVQSVPGALRICFVGNSLTYVNDLPGMLTALSRAAGDDPPIETRTVAFPNYALEDHLAQGDAVRAIEEGWDIVALQQGPSSLPASRANLIEYSRRFAAIIRGAGARPALYGVWPEAARLYAFDASIESYRAAADSVGGLSFPAALAWKIGWRLDPSLPLYGPDQFHPSVLGTYTAAVVIYAVLRDRSPIGLPNRFELGGSMVVVDSLQAHSAQLAAAEATGRVAGNVSPLPEDRHRPPGAFRR